MRPAISGLFDGLAGPVDDTGNPPSKVGEAVEGYYVHWFIEPQRNAKSIWSCHRLESDYLALEGLAEIGPHHSGANADGTRWHANANGSVERVPVSKAVLMRQEFQGLAVRNGLAVRMKHGAQAPGLFFKLLDRRERSIHDAPHAVAACGYRGVLALPSARMPLVGRIGSLSGELHRGFRLRAAGALNLDAGLDNHSGLSMSMPGSRSAITMTICLPALGSGPEEA